MGCHSQVTYIASKVANDGSIGHTIRLKPKALRAEAGIPYSTVESACGTASEQPRNANTPSGIYTAFSQATALIMVQTRSNKNVQAVKQHSSGS